MRIICKLNHIIVQLQKLLSGVIESVCAYNICLYKKICFPVVDLTSLSIKQLYCFIFLLKSKSHIDDFLLYF